MMRFPDIPSMSIKLMLFPFSLEGSAWIWLEKEPPRSILTWDDLVSKFINQFFPSSKTTNLRNEITRFQQRFNESFYEAWDRFNDHLQACPHYGFSELHQLDTFYNALNANDQDSLNSAAGGNFLDKMPREYLRIIDSKSKVRNSRNKAVVAKVSSNSSTLGVSPDVAALTTEVSELKNMMKTMLIDKQKAQAPAPVKAVEQSCVTCGGANSYRNCPATDGNVYRDNLQEYVSQAAAANFNQGNTNSRPPMHPPDLLPSTTTHISAKTSLFNTFPANPQRAKQLMLDEGVHGEEELHKRKLKSKAKVIQAYLREKIYPPLRSHTQSWITYLFYRRLAYYLLPQFLNVAFSFHGILPPIADPITLGLDDGPAPCPPAPPDAVAPILNPITPPLAALIPIFPLAAPSNPSPTPPTLAPASISVLEGKHPR
ncbi:reverse transcriptase domain-containing protein [Tanacetum coccineum]